MIFDELVLHNVGIFSGRHELKLTPPTANKPVILIGGLNGAGKTTIRDALYLVLYGPLAQSSTRRTGSYERYLRGLISRDQSAVDGAAIELAFRVHRQGDVQHYRLRRHWRATGKSCREILTVFRDGKPDQALAGSWAQHVETLLPRGVAGLFLFDGEQIEAMADMDQSKEVLRSALASLLGLDLVDRLDDDLAVLRRRHRERDLPADLRHRVVDSKAVTDRSRGALDRQRTLVASALEDVEQAEKKHVAATQRYAVAGGELAETRTQHEQRLSELRRDLLRVDSELLELATGAAPLLFLTEQLASLAQRAETEALARRDRLVLDVLADHDQGILDQLRASKVRASTVAKLERQLEAEQTQRHQSATAAEVTGLPSADGPALLCRHVLPDVRRQLDSALQRRQEVESHLAGLEDVVASIPDSEMMQPLLAERDAAADQVARAQAAYEHALERRDLLVSESERLEQQHERLLDEIAQAGFVVDDSRRVVDHVDRVRETLVSFKAAATRRHVDRIAALVVTSLRRLFRKEGLIADMAIDPTTFEIELRGTDGQVLTTEMLSAGERQLLAVGLLWGLAQASGQPLPVVIDTPLGRLDSTHRQRLLEHYFPQVSHQVILLSTDTEIDQEAHQTLRRHIGHEYTLRFDPKTSTTAVERGYFWES